MEWKEYNICQLCDTISETYKGKSNSVVLINTSDVLEGKVLNHKRVPNKGLKGQFKKTFKNFKFVLHFLKSLLLCFFILPNSETERGNRNYGSH